MTLLVSLATKKPELVLESIRPVKIEPTGSGLRQNALMPYADSSAFAELQTRLASVQKRTRNPAAANDPIRQLESMLIRNFIGAMMPKDATGIFGTGLAGEYWNSMFAESLADLVSTKSNARFDGIFESKIQNNSTK